MTTGTDDFASLPCILSEAYFGEKKGKTKISKEPRAGKSSRWSAFKIKCHSFPRVRPPTRNHFHNEGDWSSIRTLPVVSHDRRSSLNLALFNREEQSDVVFLVGPEPEVWRFPGHSSVLRPVSPVFESLFSFKQIESRKPTSVYTGSFITSESVIREESGGVERHVVGVKDVAPDAFQALIRYIYTQEFSLTSTNSALSVFHVANKFMVFSLSKVCLTFVLDHLHPHNVLEILEKLRNPCDATQCADIENIRNEVLCSCMGLVDAYAEFVLRSDAFEHLNRQTMTEIVARDTLRVASETTVFEAVMRWASMECKRQRRNLLPASKREVLGDTVYAVRYLTMTPDEFAAGPAREKALTDEETSAVLAAMRGKSFDSVPANLSSRITARFRCRASNAARLDPETPGWDDCPLSSSFSQRLKRDEFQRTTKRLFERLGDLFIYVFQLLD